MIDHSVAGVNAVYNLHADALDHYMHDMTSVLLLPLYSTVKLYLMSGVLGRLEYRKAYKILLLYSR